MIVVESSRSPEEVAGQVSRLLSVALRERDSSVRGAYYSGWPESKLKLTLNRDPMYLPSDPPDERYFVSEAPDAQFVLWDADDEDATVEKLRGGGLHARVVSAG